MKRSLAGTSLSFLLQVFQKTSANPPLSVNKIVFISWTYSAHCIWLAPDIFLLGDKKNTKIYSNIFEVFARV
jgi:hypothetical protein